MLCGTRRPTGTTLCSTRCPPIAPRCTVRAARPAPRCAVCGCCSREPLRSCSRCYAGSALAKSSSQSYSESPETKISTFLQPFCDCGLRRKSAGDRLHDGLFSLYGDGRESVIAKRLQKRLIFCFHDGWIAPTGRFRNGRIAETGQIMQMCGFSLAASRPGLGLPIRRSGSLGHAALGGAG